MSDFTEKALLTIPVDCRTRFETLLSADFQGIDAQLEAVVDYEETVESVARLVHNLNLTKAKQLSGLCRDLLNHARTLDEEGQKVVLAATEYFLTEEDDDEATGILSLHDDQVVLSAIAEYLDCAKYIPEFTGPG